jgi:hypothetical protein
MPGIQTSWITVVYANTGRGNTEFIGGQVQGVSTGGNSEGKIDPTEGAAVLYAVVGNPSSGVTRQYINRVNNVVHTYPFSTDTFGKTTFAVSVGVGGNNWFFSGHIMEILLFPFALATAPSDACMQGLVTWTAATTPALGDVIGYLRTKWGITT